MGNPEKETVDVPVSAIEDHNKSSSAELPTETTAIATESNSVPEQESSAPEATRPLQNPSAIAPSTAPPTYEEYVPSYKTEGNCIIISAVPKKKPLPCRHQL
jgi:hypothetical protein